MWPSAEILAILKQQFFKAFLTLDGNGLKSIDRFWVFSPFPGQAHYD